MWWKWLRIQRLFLLTTIRVVRWLMKTGTVHNSNVDVMQEMVDITAASRSFESAVEGLKYSEASDD